MAHHEPQLFGEKACSKCLEVKHVLAFAAEPQNKDGLRSWCRECTNAASRLSKRRKSWHPGRKLSMKRKVLDAKMLGELDAQAGFSPHARDRFETAGEFEGYRSGYLRAGESSV